LNRGGSYSTARRRGNCGIAGAAERCRPRNAQSKLYLDRSGRDIALRPQAARLPVLTTRNRVLPQSAQPLQHTGATMRMMLKFTLPVEKSNAAINDGSIMRTMETLMSRLKPEAAYFAVLEGKRGGMIFFDLTELSQIAEVVEPLFLNLNATTELVPVMNGEELRKGLAKVLAK
jgi:hypothetical protein